MKLKKEPEEEKEKRGGRDIRGEIRMRTGMFFPLLHSSLTPEYSEKERHYMSVQDRHLGRKYTKETDSNQETV